jgi:tripartite-type tricarboxylate transporter receptor subunit TctC
MRIVAAALALQTIGLCAAASAQDLPCSQVRLVVPYPAGGATDVAARVVAERLDAAFKKPFVVENRAGATGNIGTVAVVNAPADGCTLLINATVIATFPQSFSKLAYDPFKDLAPVGGVGVTPTLLVAAPSVPAKDIKDLVALSQSKPDGLNYSTAGYGLQQHLATEEIAQRTGLRPRARHSVHHRARPAGHERPRRAFHDVRASGNAQAGAGAARSRVEDHHC